MTITQQILNYASTQSHPFRKRDMMEVLKKNNISKASAHVMLNRLLEQNKLERTGYGLYALPKQGKQEFLYLSSPKEQELARQIKEKFPFMDFCVWKPSILVRYMHHVPLLRMTFIDVERVAMEPAFHFLQDIVKDMTLLLNPTAQECERYITTDNVTIVRPLIGEAPITTENGCPVPTLEKILVDAICDKELNFAQGAEFYTIYENVSAAHPISMKRLLRYAARRNRKEAMQKVIATLNL